LKLESDETLSNFAFNSSLRCYKQDAQHLDIALALRMVSHSRVGA
jgi:hypothetical protein